ncbi:hypothetical protein [Streptomyces niveus]|uniref:hypothetical protein n=1 Tax=Streptomyces niveus TaxID=193462 RepID=UPI00341AF5C8
MAWDGVPWFVEGTSASEETLRLIADAAVAGGEGVIGPADLVVTALELPGSAVQVGTGAMIARYRTGGGGQAYAARMPTVELVDVEPTGADGPRTDLVIARIEDPYGGEGWPEPEDPSAGPYVFTRILTDVPAGTTSVHQVDDALTAVTLARIDVPAGTSTITQGMITDLRDLARPRSQTISGYLYGVWETPDEVGPLVEWEEFPLGARWTHRAPEWATHATLDVQVTGLRHADAVPARGKLRVTAGEHLGAAAPYAAEAAGRVSAMARHVFTLDVGERGELVDVTMQGIGTEGIAGVLQADANTALHYTLTFHQAPVSA